MRMKTRAISEGAMMLAMIVITLIANRQMASTLELLLYLISIPIIIYTVKYGMKMGMILSVCSMLMGLMFSSLTSVFYLISAVIIGLMYAYGCIHHYKGSSLLLLITLLNLFVTYLSVVMLGAIFGYDIQSEINFLMSYIPTLFMESQLVYGYMLIVVMVSYLAFALMQACTIHFASMILLKRLKVRDVTFKANPMRLRMPKSIALIGVMMMGMYLYLQGLDIAPNVMLFITFVTAVFFVILIVDGFITCVYFLQKKQITRWRIFLILICCLLPILQIMIAIIGIYDIVSDKRSRMKVGVHNEIH